MQILEVIISNNGKPTEEIINAISNAFPDKSFNTLKGYIYSLHKSGYINVKDGDNKIFLIGVNSSAYVALDKAKNQQQESKESKNVFNIGQIHGQVAMGNTGGSYELNMSNVFNQSMCDGLKEAISAADNQNIDNAEREEIKFLLQQILETLQESQKPPEGLIKKISAAIQKHSWIAAPIATQAFNLLARNF